MEQAAPPKRKTSTLTIVLAGIGAAFCLMLVAVGVVIYALLSSPEGKAMGEAVKVASKAQKAPGTKELRAMGCQQAMVMDLEDLGKLWARLDSGVTPETSPFGEMVVCSVSPWKSAPSCDDVAMRYVGAVGNRPRPFIVNAEGGKTKQSCTVLYDEDGGRAGEGLDPSSAPAMPPPVVDDSEEEPEPVTPR